MNTHNNKRRQSTVKRIEDAFLSELKEKNISQIRIADICKLAEINRSTFYANDSDIYDLADRMFQQLEQDVFQLLSQDTECNYNDRDFLRLFQHIAENQDLYRSYFKLGYVHQNDMKLYDLYIQQHLQEEYIDYHITFFQNGFNGIVKKWLDRGCQESPQHMTDILLAEYQGRVRCCI